MGLEIVIIGGGPAGFFGATKAAEDFPDARVTIIEGTARPLMKVLLSGGGRCNVTHHCFDPKRLVTYYPRGSRELLGPFHTFQPQDTVAWFAKRGVTLKVEPDGRMFPVTDSSRTIADTLQKAARDAGVHILLSQIVRRIDRGSDGRFHLTLSKSGDMVCDRILLTTGSSPAGHTLASSLGHRIIDPVPSLFTFEIKHPLLQDLAGQSLKDVQLKLSWSDGTTHFTQRGPMLITHWGLSGPAVLKLSAFAARELHDHQYQGLLSLNIFPDETQDGLLQRLTQMKADLNRKQMVSTPLEGISRNLWERLLDVAACEPTKSWADVSSKDLRKLCEFLMNIKLTVQGKGLFKEEFVTCGGVHLKEVDFKTLQSRLVPGLFFAGEVLDIDGITGGFNFQNGWTTGWIAGQNIGK